MDVITGEFKDLASCFLLNVNQSGSLAVLAGHKVYGLVQLYHDLSYYVTTRRLEQGTNNNTLPIQDIKFGKGKTHNIIAEASANNVILHDCTVKLELKKSIEFCAHKRDVTSIDWSEKTDLLGKLVKIFLGSLR